MKKLAYFCGILLLVLLMVISGARIVESVVQPGDQTDNNGFVSRTITRDGVDYYPRQDITVLMLLGIDQPGPVKASESYNNSGAADMVALAIFDEAAEEYTILHINRDTMLSMPVLGLNGKPAGTYYGQLALSHTYGSGLEDSCENTKAAVSELLYGLTIDYYVAMNFDAIPILNDAVGGVTVVVEDDFSAVDPSITMGEMTLRGEQAIHFVRNRKNVGDQTNETRMKRHMAYVEGFFEALNTQLEQGDEFIVTAYEEASPYLVTDCSVNTINGMLQRYSGYTMKELRAIEGEHVVGDIYMEFYPDADKLDELILSLFYAPK